MKKSILAIFYLILIQSFFAKNADPFVRYPAINNDGSKIAFSFQGDIWVVPANGGKAERLTVHQAYDSRPVWSKDGKNIIFQSDRYGNEDIFIMPSEGGMPVRLTYHSADDELFDCTSAGEAVFTTNRTFKQLEWDSELQKINLNGGTPQRLVNSIGNMPSVSPNGRFIAFTRGWGRVTREKYRGSGNYDVWIYDTDNDKYNRITDFAGNDFLPKWGSDNTLYFISPLSGIYNIYKIDIDKNGNKNGEAQRITAFNENGIRYFNISSDGAQLVFERGTAIYKMQLNGSQPEKVKIEISADYKLDPSEWKTFTSDIDQYVISPNGKYSAMVIRGEIFLTENDKDKSKTINLSNHPYRDQQPQWLSDSTLIFVSDRAGQNDLYLVKSADPKESNLFKSMKHEIVRLTDTDEEETWPIISPDKKQIAYEVGTGKLLVGDISGAGKITNQKTLLDGWAAPSNVSWSPDSKWLAYSMDDLYYNEEIYIQAADASMDPVNISMHPRSDSSPFWSKDGKKLAFISNRNNNNNDVWFVWLNKKDWDKTKLDWEENDKDDQKKDKKKKDSKDSVAVEPVVIDFTDIYQRLVQVTSLPGDELSPIISKDGELIYFISREVTEKRNDLYSIKWDGSDIKQITKGGTNPSAITFDNEYKNIFMLKSGKIVKLNIGNEKQENIAFSAKMKIDFTAEREQIFEEAWRALNEGFYDPAFHGNNWNELKEKYKPWCLMTSTSRDFTDIFNYMLGEINASHMGLRGLEERAETQKEKVGELGVDVEPVANGVKVTRVIPNTPADKEQSKLMVGDVITSVNGTAIKSYVNFFSLLINKADEQVLLSVQDSKGGLREVVIRPGASINDELYDEWVDQRKLLVDKYSNGRLGYLHIRGMSMPSFERFERELTARGLGKEGIVIDVRFNGGGWTTDYLMTILNYKQHAYTIPRGAAANLEKEHKNFREYYPLGERLPYAAWIKPSIALCNQNSYSNAEIFSHAYKHLGIGKLVGVPTFGAVISTGARGLIDGSYVRLPGRGWYVSATDKNMDFEAATPDIIIYEQPDEKANGTDSQLKAAVDELLKEIDAKK